MAWTVEKVFLMATHRTLGDVAIAKKGVRECGCMWMLGVRCDNHETTFITQGCEAHNAIAGQALEEVRDLPPSDEQVQALFERALERKLGGH